MRFEDQRCNDDMSVASYTTSGLSRPQPPQEMFYGVVWSTDDRSYDESNWLDLAENKERWLAKLGSWSDALGVYEEKLMRNPDDLDATLGCMHCLSSSGEWRRVLDLAEDNWLAISTNTSETTVISQTTAVPSREKKKALRMCAEAAWYVLFPSYCP